MGVLDSLPATLLERATQQEVHLMRRRLKMCWMSHELLLPDLSLGKKPPTSHIASSHIESKDCPAGRGGGEVGCGKDASPQKSKGVLLGHRLPLVHEEHERRSKKVKHGHYLPINILL